MLWSFLTTVVVAAIHGAASAPTAGTGGPAACVTFDINWNLLAFGFNGKDYNAGTQDTWSSSGAPTDITTSGRPPFNSASTTCYLSQFTNAIYVLNADTANPTSVYIYDATAKTWSTQSVTAGKFDPTNFAAILDHDTNVFYAYSNGEIFSLDMALLKSATSSAIPWNDVQTPDLSATASATPTPGANTAGYQPVVALAQNHIHFLGVPGIAAGNAKIFVIHFSFMQPAPQFYGTAFPSTHGKAASFFLDAGVQQEFAFIPDDGSATYVVNVETNTTKTLTGPPQQDPFATYAASTSALVQLTASGQVAFLAYNPNTTTSGGTWSTISKLPSAGGTLTGGGSSGNSGAGAAGGSGTPSSGSGTGSSTGSSGNNSGSPSTTKNGAGTKMGVKSLSGMLVAMGLATVGVLVV
ncbi:hypothetical protein GALMADRAFT_251824 [Galerina marginata CBS 339.88]|uniref:Uncharacterized protein n=1 Tax=Galerina marginata (strain CBS 339.88) TaxID=685588 RepID=A0A067SZW9_GALM3|nr:hypothetical protein GALMADRAFT_251824 [Galerina marginata CBS 339.88]